MKKIFLILFLIINLSGFSYEKIVSLVPNVTEIIFELELDDKIVGVTSWCDYPAEAKTKTIISNAVNFSSKTIENILLTNAEIVFIAKTSKQSFVKELEKFKIKVIKTNPNSIDELYRDILKIGKILNVENKAINLNNNLKSKINSIISKIPKKKRPKIFIDLGNLYTVSKKSFVGNLIELSGGINIINTKIDYPKVTQEKVISENPDIIVIGNHSGTSIEEIKSRIGWQNINAVKNNKIFQINSDIIFRPSPRIYLGIKELYEAFYKK